MFFSLAVELLQLLAAPHDQGNALVARNRAVDNSRIHELPYRNYEDAFEKRLMPLFNFANLLLHVRKLLCRILNGDSPR